MGDLHIDRNAGQPGTGRRHCSVEVGAPLVKSAGSFMPKKRPVAYLIDILPEDILTPR